MAGLLGLRHRINHYNIKKMIKILLLKYKWYAVALAAVLLLAIGFFIGRANQKKITNTVIEYLPGKEIRDSIPYPVPYETIVHQPKDVIHYLPSKKDTVWKDSNIYISEKIDTAKIVEQFAVENKYKQTLFDNDSLGSLIINSSVQYNQQKSLAYSFTPVHKVITNTIKRKNTFTPFVSASYNTLNYGGVGGGIFIKNIGFEYKYLSNLKGSKGHECGIKIKL